MLVRPIIVGLVSAFLVSITAYAQTPDLSQYVATRYENKIFLIRGFYANTELRYDPTGVPVSGFSPGFWTVHGFILVTDAKVSPQKLVIKAKRMIVIADGKGFRFHADNPKKIKRADNVEIEASLATGSREEIDMMAAKIFLTDNDSLLAQVPWFWQTCLSGGLNQVNDSTFTSCQFSKEMLAIPGVNAHADLRPKAEGKTEPPVQQRQQIYRVGTAVSPPKTIFSPEPQFSTAARAIGFQGVATLGLMVDAQGLPRNVKVLSPLGAGLDEEAVAMISTWKFKPAEQKGNGPVPVEIAVEVDFHRY